MKTIFTISILSIMFLLTSSCDEEIKNDVESPKQIFIFSDLTTSLHLDDIKVQSDKIKRLINEQSFNFQISVYPMDVSVHQDPLYEAKIPPLDPTHQSKNIAIKNKKKTMADSIRNILINTYTKHSQNNADFKSCIVSSFDMAYNLLPDDEELLNQTQVLFFTDMIEQCPESTLGSLYMCSSSREPNFDKILKQVDENYNPTFKLNNKLSEDQIHIVVTSSYGNQKRCITEDQQSQVWDKILIKLGYNEPKKIHRKSSVPKLW